MGLHTSRYVVKMWKQSVVPLHTIDSFGNCGQLADGSVDWIDADCPEDLEYLFANRKIDIPEDGDGEMMTVWKETRDFQNIC